MIVMMMMMIRLHAGILWFCLWAPVLRLRAHDTWQLFLVAFWFCAGVALDHIWALNMVPYLLSRVLKYGPMVVEGI